MNGDFDVSIEGYHFHVSRTQSGYAVEWLDCPDETYPSGYFVARAGCEENAEPLFAESEIIADIKQWLAAELSNRV